MRNTEKQPEVVRFITGIDQSGGTRGAQPGTFEVVKNMRFQSGGLQKRCGTAAVTGETIGTAHHLADTASNSRPTEKAAFIGRFGNQKVSGTSAGDAFVYGGTEHAFNGCFSAAQPVRKRLGISPTRSTSVPGPYVAGCAATSGGYVCTASGFGNGELSIAVEAPSGEQIFADTVVGAVSAIVRVVCVGSVFYVCYQQFNATTVSVRTLTISGGAVTDGGAGTLVTLNNASSTWDTSNYDGTNWWLVYQSAATTVTLAKMSGTTASATVTFATTDNLTYLSLWADTVTARIWVGVVDDPTGTPTTAFRVYTTVPALSLGPTTLTSAVTTGPPLLGPLYTRSPAAGDAFYCYSQATAAGPPGLMAGTVSAGTPTTARSTAWNCVPISKPDVGHRVWVMTYGTANFTTVRVCLVRVEDAGSLVATGGPSPVVELALPLMETPGANFHPQGQRGRAFHAVAVTSDAAGGSAFFAAPFVLTSHSIDVLSGSVPTIQINLLEYTRHNQEPHRQMLPMGRSGVVTGQPTELWGTPGFSSASMGAVEFGYAHAPSIISATPSTGAGTVAAGDYIYQALHEWVDDEGNRHLSAPSDPVTVTAVDDTVAVVLVVAGCYLGQRSNAARGIDRASPNILIYRTQANAENPQFLVGGLGDPAASWDGRVSGSDVGSIANAANEFIYTAGGVLPNVLAPSCRYIAVSEERLWCGGLWDSNIIECSKVRVPQEPFNFTGHPSHQVVIPGEVSGLAYMDGQVCVFTEDAIYLVSGDGPNDQGAGGFAPPRALVRGIGCPREQSASILETEAGILFRSAMGFYAIPRGFGTPQYIGDKVQDENPLVLSAATTTTSDNRLARFLVATAGGTKSNKVLTLDLTNMQWIRDEYTVDGAVITGQGFSEIGEWPDGLALMSYGLDRADNPNVIWSESEDLTGDAGAAGVSATTYISQYARTNWIQPAGPAGLVRCTSAILVCEPIGSSSVLTMLIETDNNSDHDESWTLTTSEEVAYRGFPPAQATCTEFRLTVSDAAGATDSAGVRLLALGLETQPVPGLRRLADSEGA